MNLVKTNLDLEFTESFSVVDSGVWEIFPSLLARVKSLRVLNLSGNNLVRLSRVFSNDPDKLWRLDLSKNRIVEIRSNFFERMVSLKELDLSSNNIMQFIFESYNHLLTRLELFDVYGE